MDALARLGRECALGAAVLRSCSRTFDPIAQISAGTIDLPVVDELIRLDSARDARVQCFAAVVCCLHCSRDNRSHQENTHLARAQKRNERKFILERP